MHKDLPQVESATHDEIRVTDDTLAAEPEPGRPGVHLGCWHRRRVDVVVSEVVAVHHRHMIDEGRSWSGLWLTWLTAIGGALAALIAGFFAIIYLAIAADGVNDYGGLFSCTDMACVQNAWLIGGIALTSVVLFAAVVFLAAFSTFESLRWAMKLGYVGASLIAALGIIAGTSGDGAGFVLLLMVPVLGLLGLGSELRLRARGGKGWLDPLLW